MNLFKPGRGGAWSKLKEFTNKNVTHKFSARSIERGNPSFMLKHDIISNGNEESELFPFVIYDIDEMYKSDIDEFFDIYKLNEFKNTLATILFDYIKKRRVKIKKEFPYLTNDELEYALSKRENKYTLKFKNKDDNLLRLSMINLDVYNKKYFLFTVEKKHCKVWIIESDQLPFVRVSRLVSAEELSGNIMQQLFNDYRRSTYSQAFYGYDNELMSPKVKEIIEMAIRDKYDKFGKIKPFLKLRLWEYTESDYGAYIFGIPKNDKSKIVKELIEFNESLLEK